MMNHKETDQQVSRSPAVHRLYYGAFLQAPIWISPDVLAVPHAALGFNAEVAYVTTYLRQFFEIELTSDQVKAGVAQGAESLPVITVIHFPVASAQPEVLEAEARAKLEQAEQIIAWVNWERLTEFAYVTVTGQDPPFFRTMPPHSRRRQRLGFGNTTDAFKNNVDRIRQAINEDLRFAFAMAIFADATHEANPLFRVEFVQDNHSKSAKAVVRGLHYQMQNTQGKLVRVAVDAGQMMIGIFFYRTPASSHVMAMIWC